MSADNTCMYIHTYVVNGRCKRVLYIRIYIYIYIYIYIFILIYRDETPETVFICTYIQLQYTCVEHSHHANNAPLPVH